MQHEWRLIETHWNTISVERQHCRSIYLWYAATESNHEPLAAALLPKYLHGHIFDLTKELPLGCHSIRHELNCFNSLDRITAGGSWWTWQPNTQKQGRDTHTNTKRDIETNTPTHHKVKTPKQITHETGLNCAAKQVLGWKKAIKSKTWEMHRMAPGHLNDKTVSLMFYCWLHVDSWTSTRFHSVPGSKSLEALCVSFANKCKQLMESSSSNAHTLPLTIAIKPGQQFND